ncbi:MAG: IS4 family transposase [Bacteroidia bacterium]|nr:IS4 family transposase [Bacteroidia bacterium]
MQDSTCIGLDDKLFEFFKGNYSRGERKSVAKIDLIFELNSSTCKKLDLKGYNENDQSAAMEIIPLLQPGNLVIRDLGYFTLGGLEAIQKAGAHFLSRYRYGTDCLNPKTGKKIQLAHLLKKKKVLDMEILLGAKKKLKCRLIAIPLPDSVAEEKRRKAKNDRHASANHSEDYLSVLGWKIFVTSVGKDVWDIGQAKLAYQARWQIEIIFKSWKSHLNLENLNNQGQKCPEAVKSKFWAALIFILLFVFKFYQEIRWHGFEKTGKHLSIIKLTQFLSLNLETVLKFLSNPKLPDLIAYCCPYEKRLNRLNLTQKFLGQGLNSTLS